jgi:glycosyltransferase involved in cell wall biosynthesis
MKAKATSNIQILGYQPFSVLRDYMQKAKAFVFAAEEDFGIAVVEAQACGTPVICYGRGAARETVVADQTGIFFYEQSPQAIREAVIEFEKHAPFDRCLIRANAERFSRDIFRASFREFVEDKYERHRKALGLRVC